MRGWQLADGLAVVLSLSIIAGAPLRAEDAGEQRSPQIAPIEQSELLAFLAGRGDFTLIDARTPDEYASGHVAGAVNVPHDALAAHLDRVPADRSQPIVVYCKTGMRASKLRDALLARGYADVRVLGPTQMFWFGDAPVFNCGAPTAAEPQPSSFLKPTN